MPKLWDLFVWGVAASVGLVGCVNSAQRQLIPPPTEPPGQTQIQELEPPEEKPKSTLPRRLEVSLTLSSPNDLRVKPGQEIKAGQVLSDRTEERKQLEQRRNLLQISLKSLEIKPQAPAPLQPVPPIPELPPADFSREEASVNKAELVMQQSNQTIVQQQEKIIAFKEIPNIPEAIIEHEQAKLRKLTDQLKLIQADYQQAIAVLKNAQASRYQQEYQHQLQVSQRLLDIQAQQLWAERAHTEYASRVQDLEFQKAAVLTQLQGIDEQLQEVTAVTTPFSGKVRKIKHQGQTDRYLRVAVVIDVERDASNVSRTAPLDEPDVAQAAVNLESYQESDRFFSENSQTISTELPTGRASQTISTELPTGSTRFPTDRTYQQSYLAAAISTVDNLWNSSVNQQAIATQIKPFQTVSVTHSISPISHPPTVANHIRGPTTISLVGNYVGLDSRR